MNRGFTFTNVDCVLLIAIGTH